MLFYIKNLTDEMLKIRIEKFPEDIQYLKNPSREMQEIAVRSNAYVISMIDNPLEEIKDLSLKIREENMKRNVNSISHLISEKMTDKNDLNKELSYR